MKILHTLQGTKRIEDSDPNVTLLKVRQILDDQRTAIINRLITDLPVYIDYRFRVKPDVQQLQTIREKLYTLKNSGLDLEKYDDILQHVVNNEKTYVSSEPFYKEIDENINWHLNASQLRLVK